MRLLERLSRKAEKGSAGNPKKISGTWELEIYSGMRVLVENLEGNLLFIATLKDPQMHTIGKDYCHVSQACLPIILHYIFMVCAVNEQA